MYEEKYTNTEQNQDTQYNFNKEAVLHHLEKSEIRKVANRTSLSMMLLFAVTVLLGFSYGFIALLLGVSKEKIMEIIKNNDIRSVTILRMEVPCCGGLEMAAKKALQESGKFIPWQTITISIDGKILDD